MIYLYPVVDINTKIDVYAGNERTYKELLPLWEALDERQGTFFASRFVSQNGAELTRVEQGIEGDAPLVVVSYKDLSDISIPANGRPLIMYEPNHTAETRGLLNIVSLFLCADQNTLRFRKGYVGAVEKINDAYEAAQKIFTYCKGREVKHITHINEHTIGIVYMAWGEKALSAVKKSVATLRSVGYQYPVTIIGDFLGKPCDNFNLIQCDITPFDRTKAHNFQFRAGRIKPALFELSPYDYTLYIDADTYFIQPIQSAFELLDQYDLVVTEEKLTLKELYNKKLAGWELNMLERDVTLAELNSDGSDKFINSGVIFFKKNTAVGNLFTSWQEEWMRFQEWDEQLALMRALHRNNVNVKSLPVEWNSPHLEDNTIIFHNYGRGTVR